MAGGGHPPCRPARILNAACASSKPSSRACAPAAGEESAIARPPSSAGFPSSRIATGPDLAKGELRGHARGILAIGDIATGVVALGGLARGLVAFGGLAVGVITFGGASFGALAAVGGLAVGSIAFGGGAVGWTAIGGAAVGTYACGGGAFGEHVISPARRDAEAIAHFERLGLGAICDPDRKSRRAG